MRGMGSDGGLFGGGGGGRGGKEGGGVCIYACFY